jgi:6-pyruvoyltetrahydropterin/6-carboxytetrahydropterin synthase
MHVGFMWKYRAAAKEHEMYTLRIEGKFSAAHYLNHYHGKCENLHGHNYRVRVYAEGEELDEGGMLIDFGILKQQLRDVLQSFDHCLLNETEAFANSEASAENIARVIFEKLHDKLPEAPLSRVEVFETDINMAAYSPSSDSPH